MKDKSASVLVTVSGGRSKTLIGAAISPHRTSAACQMKMEGIHAFVCACSRGTHKHFFNHFLYWTNLLVSLHSHHIRHVIIFCRGHTGKCCLPPVHLNHILHCTSVWLLPLSLLHIGLIRILLTSHFHPSVFLSLTERSCQTCRSTLHKHLSFVCRLRACSNLEMGWICPLVYWRLKKFLSVFAPLTQTCIDTVRRAHKQKRTSLPFPSQLVICAKALGVGGEVSAVIW